MLIKDVLPASNSRCWIASLSLAMTEKANHPALSLRGAKVATLATKQSRNFH
jgi:hypothetical protein